MNIEKTYNDLADRYENGDLDRRQFLRGVGLMALTSGIAGSAVMGMVDPARAATALRFESWGGPAQQAFVRNVLNPFTKETGVEVNVGSFGNEQELLTRIAAEGTSAYNVFNAGNPSTALLFIERGYTQELEIAKIPRLKTVIQRAVDVYASLASDGHIAAVPYFTTGVSIAYNHDRVDPKLVEEQGFNILLNKSLAANITAEDQWQRRICYAALQTNQDINNITDMDAVWQKVAESKRNIFKYYRSSAEQTQLLSSGAAWVADAWFAPIGQMKRAGLPISHWPNSGTYVNFASLVVIKGTPLERAYEMMDVLLRPEVQIAQSIASANVTLLNPQLVELPQAVKDILGYDPTGELKAFRTLDPKYWNSHSAEWSTEYRKVIERA